MPRQLSTRERIDAEQCPQFREVAEQPEDAIGVLLRDEMVQLSDDVAVELGIRLDTRHALGTGLATSLDLQEGLREAALDAGPRHALPSAGPFILPPRLVSLLELPALRCRQFAVVVRLVHSLREREAQRLGLAKAPLLTESTEARTQLRRHAEVDGSRRSRLGGAAPGGSAFGHLCSPVVILTTG
ncbi:MAG: hypothetical protein HYY42_04450 [Chloroflexi bacterium]|nr:hypothetical protein [Chloroflexota bacterium]